ncbi:MAG: hypothetical protein ACE5F1_04860 [Planctomycetota bacterium]
MKKIVALSCTTLLVLQPACMEPESRPIEITRIVKKPAVEFTKMPSEKRFGFRRRVPEMGAPSGDLKSSLSWDDPAGWKKQPPTGFRLANFLAGGHAELECYLTVLPRMGEDPVGANVNRWRKQLSQEPLDAAGIRALPKETVLGHEATRVEIEGTFVGMGGSVSKEGYKLLGLILEHGSSILFVKMVGPAKLADAEREAFLGFCRSLRVSETGGHDPGHAGHQSTLAWTAPESWQQGPARQMREVTFYTGKGKTTECYIAILGGGAGGVEANINRWRNQLAKEALSSGQINELPRIPVLGRQAALVEVSGTFTGMSGPAIQDATLLGVICELPRITLFVKMIGPAAEVKAEREAFIGFCKSIRMGN